MPKEVSTSVEFIFAHFSELSKAAVGAFFDSDVRVCLGGAQFYLKVYPNGRNEEEKGALACFLCAQHTTVDMNVSFALNIQPQPHRRGTLGDVERHCTKMTMSESGSGGTGWTNIIPTEALMASYSSDDAVSLHVRISATGVNCGATAPNIPNTRMLSLLREKTHADMTLQVQNRSIQAHKCIICPRSPVFKAMFETPMVEAASNTVTVTGFSMTAVKAMLCFLYADLIPTAGLKQVSLEMLELSIYYQIDDLRAYVEDFCVVHMCVATVKDCLQFATQHAQCTALAVAAKKYIAEHAKTLMSSPDFMRSLDSMETCVLVMKAMAGATEDAGMDKAPAESSSHTVANI